jgi:hypothetical protein
MDEDCLRIGKLEIEKMKNAQFVELLILKCKHEQYDILQAVKLIYEYVKLDLDKHE